MISDLKAGIKLPAARMTIEKLSETIINPIELGNLSKRKLMYANKAASTFSTENRWNNCIVIFLC